MAAPAAAFTIIPTADIDPDSPLVSSLMVSIVDNTENVFAQLVGDPVATPTFTPAAEHDHDGVNSKVVSGADFILVEKKLVTADVTSVTFSGLNGETDEVYKLVARIIVQNTLANFVLRPNGITTNQTSLEAIGAGTFSDLRLATGFGSGSGFISFESLFWARKSVNSIAMKRLLHSDYGTYGTIPTPESGDSLRGLWSETSTTITSLVIVSSVASEIRDGSTIALYKLRQ